MGGTNIPLRLGRGGVRVKKEYETMDADVMQDVTDIEWNSVGVSFRYANRDYACRKNGEVNMRGWQIMLEDLRNVPKIVDALRARRDGKIK